VEQEPSWLRQLLVGLSVLLVIALLVGGILAVIAVKTADYVGLGGGSDLPTSSPAPILPTTGGATHTVGPSTRTPPSTTPSTHHTRKPSASALTLTASPKRVPSFGRINLTGSYPGHDGAAVQVQRALGNGPWEDFPVHPVSVSAGRYATYVQTSMVGTNHFRVVDVVTGTASNIVTVTIG
jgi:hypothetical protein